MLYAREQGKPIFIAESSPVGFDLQVDTAQDVWDRWYEPLLQQIALNQDVIKAWSYINTDWPSQPLWDGGPQSVTDFFSTTDARLQANPEVKQLWLEAMNDDAMLLHGVEGVYQTIDFVPAL